MPTGVYKRTKKNFALRKLRNDPAFDKKRRAGLKKYWVKRRKEKKLLKQIANQTKSALKAFPDPRHHLDEKIKSRVDNTILAAKRTTRLIVIGRNPNTGADEVMENSLVTSMSDALGTVIDYMYNGTVLTEIRLENYGE